jgi:hypothetical protein
MFINFISNTVASFLTAKCFETTSPSTDTSTSWGIQSGSRICNHRSINYHLLSYFLLLWLSQCLMVMPTLKNPSFNYSTWVIMCLVYITNKRIKKSNLSSLLLLSNSSLLPLNHPPISFGLERIKKHIESCSLGWKQSRRVCVQQQF